MSANKAKRIVERIASYLAGIPVDELVGTELKIANLLIQESILRKKETQDGIELALTEKAAV